MPGLLRNSRGKTAKNKTPIVLKRSVFCFFEESLQRDRKQQLLVCCLQTRCKFVCANSFAPSPAPFPTGRGKFLILFCREASPPAPRGWNLMFCGNRKICKNFCTMWCNCKRYVQPQSLQKLHINKYMIDLGRAKERGGVGERNFGTPDGSAPTNEEILFATPL